VNCVLCRHGETKPGHVSTTLERGTTTIVVRDVPAEVCQNCGEHYLSETVTASLLRLAEEAVQKGVELEIRRFAA